MLKQKVAWLEACNFDLRRELEEARERLDTMSQCALESQVGYDCTFAQPTIIMIVNSIA